MKRERIVRLYRHYREIIIYIIVGGLTTLVSWGAKFLWNLVFYEGTVFPSNIQNFILSTVNWVAGVLFAYPMNRKWVFKSINPRIIKEMTGFVVSRLGTWILDILILQLLCNTWGINIYISTVISAILVVITNWFISKKIIFRNQYSKLP